MGQVLQCKKAGQTWGTDNWDWDGRSWYKLGSSYQPIIKGPTSPKTAASFSVIKLPPCQRLLGWGKGMGPLSQSTNFSTRGSVGKSSHHNFCLEVFLFRKFVSEMNCFRTLELILSDADMFTILILFILYIHSFFHIADDWWLRVKKNRNMTSVIEIKKM